MVRAPIGGAASKWQFTRSSVVRVRSVLRMQRCLQVDVVLALDLLERIEALNARLKSFDMVWNIPLSFCESNPRRVFGSRRPCRSTASE